MLPSSTQRPRQKGNWRFSPFHDRPMWCLHGSMAPRERRGRFESELDPMSGGVSNRNRRAPTPSRAPPARRIGVEAPCAIQPTWARCCIWRTHIIAICGIGLLDRSLTLLSLCVVFEHHAKCHVGLVRDLGIGTTWQVQPDGGWWASVLSVSAFHDDLCLISNRSRRRYNVWQVLAVFVADRDPPLRARIRSRHRAMRLNFNRREK